MINRTPGFIAADTNLGLVEIGAVRSPDDVWFDDFGNLVWTVSDPDDGIDPSQKKVVYFDGHSDTVNPLPATWREKLVATEAGVDDATLELAKAGVIRELGEVPLAPREMRLLAVEETDLVLAIVEAKTEIVSSVYRVDRTLITEIEETAEAWADLRSDLTEGLYVDIGRILTPVAA